MDLICAIVIIMEGRGITSGSKQSHCSVSEHDVPEEGVNGVSKRNDVSSSVFLYAAQGCEVA